MIETDEGIRNNKRDNLSTVYIERHEYWAFGRISQEKIELTLLPMGNRALFKQRKTTTT
jgi:hypothetical protein